MKAAEPLALNHSWPLFEVAGRFGLGRTDDAVLFPDFDDAALTRAGVGLWRCDLASGALTWSGVVHDIFGLPRDARPRRADVLALYRDESRAAMERLRAYAIRHRRGFTLDAEIQPIGGPRRWMRLIAAPVCEAGRVVRLHGVKRIVE